MKKAIVFLIATLQIATLFGCAAGPTAPSLIYSRTKDISFNGTLTVDVNQPILSVTWKFAEEEPPGNLNAGQKEIQDCFRSELIYLGLNQNKASFLIQNHLCGTDTPVSTEHIESEKEPGTQIRFFSVNLSIVEADAKRVIIRKSP